MYVPKHFAETRVDLLQEVIRDYPFATLITLNAGELNANHIPFELDPDPSPFGTLRGHVARANPVWRDLSPGVETLVLFQGAHAYISPSWYPTKRETGKVVPTWNYIVVHVYGSLRIIEDPVWLRSLVARLTNRYEAGQPDPWHVTDAPQDFINGLLRAIVGIEVSITRLIGKWKVSQNRNLADRAGVAQGLREIAQPDALILAESIEQSLFKV